MEPIVKLREKIVSKKYCIGPAIIISDPYVIEAVANHVDFLWIEMEHVLVNPQMVYSYFLAARLKELPTLVRVTSLHDSNIKPIIDSGANGIIVPQIESSEDVKNIVEQCRFKPLGKRGFGGKMAANYSCENWIKYTNEDFFIAVLIENQKAVQNIESILKVPGLDTVIIGPMDLSNSLGIPGDIMNKKVLSAIDHIISETNSAGINVGVGCSLDFNFINIMINRGIKFFQISTDFDYLSEYARQVRSKIIKE